MRSFANIFLILFVADGGFSLVDELVSLLTPLLPFSDFRNLLAGLVILLSLPMYVLLGIDSRLPKKVFVPLIAFVYWTLVSTWLLPILATLKIYGLIMSLVQLGLGVLPLYINRGGESRRLTLAPELFVRPWFQLRSTLIFLAVNLLIVPLATAAFAMSVANSYLSDYTAGFMRLGSTGITMTERSYVRDNRTVRLAAMIHIGSRDYYRSISDSVLPGRTLVLAEGVSDRERLLKHGLDYGKVAGLMGLDAQNKMLFKGRVLDREELEGGDAPRETPEDTSVHNEPDILRADVDVSLFRPETVTFLNAVGRHLGSDRSVMEGFLELNRWAEKNVTPEMYETIMDDILHRRNMTLIGYLDKALVRYETIVIPWGALHMKEVEAELLKRGFLPRDSRERTSIDFIKLLRNQRT